MEQKREQLKPLTPEQHEAEAAYAEDIRQRLGNPTPELARQIRENIKHHKRYKAATCSIRNRISAKAP